MNISRTLILSLVLLVLSSCGVFNSLTSNTTIKGQDAFILGDNNHGSFSATVTNTSKVDVTVWQYPNQGGRHSPVTIHPSETAKIRVAPNTALRIENTSSEEVTVHLKVRGDTGLSMQYQK